MGNKTRKRKKNILTALNQASRKRFTFEYGCCTSKKERVWQKKKKKRRESKKQKRGRCRYTESRNLVNEKRGKE